MPFRIIRGDITKTDADAIVNAANTSLLPGGGVCGAIFAAAGYNKLEAACRKIGHCDTGKAVITKGFKLKAKYIIHTPGPVYTGGKNNEEELLYSCYKSSLELAKSKRIESIAFPLISSGIFGYPKYEALKTATRAISDFLDSSDMNVYLVIYDKSGFESDLLPDVTRFIDEKLDEPDYSRRRGYDMGSAIDIGHAYASAQLAAQPPAEEKKHDIFKHPKKTESDELKSIDEMLKETDASFSEYLLKLIDESDMTDAQVYKRANIDRKLFSKIRNNREYKPSKVTAVAFAIALGLDMDGTRDLVGRAGYSLTHSSKFDIVIEYFITNKNYDIFEINETLFAFDLPLIGV